MIFSITIPQSIHPCSDCPPRLPRDLQVLYLVKWKGYGDDQNTWEPLRNLGNVIDLVQRFDAVKDKENEASNSRRKSLGKSGSSKRHDDDEVRHVCLSVCLWCVCIMLSLATGSSNKGHDDDDDEVRRE